MKKLICLKCKQVHPDTLDKKCPGCEGTDFHDFKNSDEYLRDKITLVLEDRRKLGLHGLVGGLNCIVINTEPDKQKAAVEEFLGRHVLGCKHACVPVVLGPVPGEDPPLLQEHVVYICARKGC